MTTNGVVTLVCWFMTPIHFYCSWRPQAFRVKDFAMCCKRGGFGSKRSQSGGMWKHQAFEKVVALSLLQAPTKHLSLGSFPILSRDPCFYKTSGIPGKTAGSWKERWLKRMGDQPLESCSISCSRSTSLCQAWKDGRHIMGPSAWGSSKSASHLPNMFDPSRKKWLETQEASCLER